MKKLFLLLLSAFTLGSGAYAFPGDTTTNGEVLCFSPEGALQFRLRAGLNPHSVVIIGK